MTEDRKRIAVDDGYDVNDIESPPVDDSLFPNLVQCLTLTQFQILVDCANV